jgi:ABC-type ATPase involved in cell division
MEDGEFVFIRGASGSGKSTLIKLMMREEKAHLRRSGGERLQDLTSR